MVREDTLPEAPVEAALAGLLVVEVAGVRRAIALPRGETILGSDGPNEGIAAPGVAPAHVAIEAVGGAVHARALAPLRRNGLPVRRTRLRTGDRLRFGAATARFVAAGDALVVDAREQRPFAWAVAGIGCGYLFALVASAVLPAPVRAASEPMAAGAIVDASRTDAPAPAADAAAFRAPASDAAPAADAVQAPARSAADRGTTGAAGVAGREPPTPGPVEVDAAAHRSVVEEAASAAQPGPGQEPMRVPPLYIGETRPTQVLVARAPAAGDGRRRERRSPAAGEAPLRAPDDLVERLWAAWEAGALQDVQALASRARDPAAARIGALARRFERAVRRARQARGLAAVPALEEALGIAEEIGRRSLAADEVRGALAALHVEAAEAAIAAGDWEGALHHGEQALAIRPGSREAGALRARLAERAGAFYREAYALQHLDPAEAIRLAERARLLAAPGGEVADKAARLAARLRAARGSAL